MYCGHVVNTVLKLTNCYMYIYVLQMCTCKLRPCNVPNWQCRGRLFYNVSIVAALTDSRSSWCMRLMLSEGATIEKIFFFKRQKTLQCQKKMLGYNVIVHCTMQGGFDITFNVIATYVRVQMYIILCTLQIKQFVTIVGRYFRIHVNNLLCMYKM